MTAPSKTDSPGPEVEPWHFANSAFCGSVKGDGDNGYQATIPAVPEFSLWLDPRPSFRSAEGELLSDTPCRLVGSRGEYWISPCEEKRDEKILLITAKSGFGGDFGAIIAVGAEIVSSWCSKRGTYRVMHILARVTTQDGYVMTETGFKSNSGLVEIFSWRGGRFQMSTPKYRGSIAAGTLFREHDTVNNELVELKKRRQELVESRVARWYYGSRLAAINAKYREANLKEPFALYEEYFGYLGYTGLEPPSYFLYEKQRVEQLILQMNSAFDLLVSYRPCRENAKEMWEIQYRAVVTQYSFIREDQYEAGIVMVHYGDYSVAVRYDNSRPDDQTSSQSKVVIREYPYSQTGLEEFLVDLEKYQAKSRGHPA